MSYNDNNYGLFQGSLFLQRRLVNGLPSGPMIGVGDADKFEISPTQTFDDIKESQSGLRMTSAHIPTGSDIKVKMNLLYASKSNLVAGLWGTDTGAVAAGSVSAATELPYAFNGGLVALANPGVTGLTVKLAGTATHVQAIAVTAGGSGYLAGGSGLTPMTLTTAVGQTAQAIVTNGVVTGVILAGTGTTLATAAAITTPGGGSGATFAIKAGQTSLVLNTDYTLDAVNGSITILPASVLVPLASDIYNLAAGQAGRTQLDVAYSYGAYTGKVEAFTTGIQYYTARLQGFNIANNNQPVIINVWQLAMDMTKMLSVLDAKHNNIELDGMCLQDTSKPLATYANPYSQFFNIVKA